MYSGESNCSKGREVLEGRGGARWEKEAGAGRLDRVEDRSGKASGRKLKLVSDR